MSDVVAQDDADDDSSGLSLTLWTDMPRISIPDSAGVHREGLKVGNLLKLCFCRNQHGPFTFTDWQVDTVRTITG